MKHAKYPHVFLPLAIGPITVRNRIFVPAHTTSYGDNNLPTDRHLAYHQARAAGGAGLIIFEAIRVHRSSLGRKQGVNGYERACIPRFRRIGDAVRNEGGKLFGQIIHLGRHIDGNYTRTPSWGASPIAWTATA
ncbi:MAG: 2,4-dienoyl-CoA reductase-like NADH-dependent reductase (Old Yellow Enzyme family), partial [Flavobacteriaceae bacterium]